MDDLSRLAVVYARYSSNKQGEQSIEGQLAAAQKYAFERGLRIVHEYVDRAQSGRTDERDAFQEMLRDTAKHQFGVILVWKVDRFGRNREEIAVNKLRCKKNGVHIEYVAETIPDTPEGVILESVLEGFAEYYSLQLAQNVRRGMLAAVEKGHIIGGQRPLGYDFVDKRLVVNEAEAKLVCHIYERYAEGERTIDIVNELNAHGHLTASGRPFNPHSLYKILQNKIYIGIYEAMGIRLEGVVPAILPVELFDRVQEMRKINKRQPSKGWYRADYLLTGKVWCGECGAPMVGDTGANKYGKRYSYYVCRNRKKEHTCRKKSINKDLLEEIVADAALDVLKDERVIVDLAGKIVEYNASQDGDSGELASLKASLRKTEANIQYWMSAVEQGIITEETKTRLLELSSHKKKLKEAIEAVEAKKAKELTADQIKEFLYSLRERQYNDTDAIRGLIRTFVQSVTVWDDKVQIVFSAFPDDGTPPKNRTVTLSGYHDRYGRTFLLGDGIFAVIKRVP